VPDYFGDLPSEVSSSAIPLNGLAAGSGPRLPIPPCGKDCPLLDCLLQNFLFQYIRALFQRQPEAVVPSLPPPRVCRSHDNRGYLQYPHNLAQFFSLYSFMM
jgi:hypothetical protein